jgi:DNA-binding transcriptional LysR family regulator
MDGAGFDEIVAFLAAFDEGSFTAAGAVLARDPSIVSRRVSALESRMGIRLFERTTRRLAPTEAGVLYYQRMRNALGMMDEAAAELSQANGKATGSLRIALPATFGPRWIANMLPDFLAGYPDVTLEAEFSDRYIDLVHERFDLAVRIGTLEDSSLIARTLASNQRIAVAAPSYLNRHGTPATPEQLLGHACLANPRLKGYPNWRFERAGAVATVAVKPRMVADDSSSLAAAAVAGIGITVCARWLVAGELDDGRLVRVLPEWEVEHSGNIHLVRPSARYTPTKTKVFVDWLVRQFDPPPWEKRPPA